MRLTKKEKEAITATGKIHVHIDMSKLDSQEATRLVKKIEIFSELPEVVNTLKIVNNINDT